MTKRNLFAASIVAAFCFSGVAVADDKKAPDTKDAKKEEKKEEVAAAPKCRALDTKDPKNVMAEVEEKSSVKCSGALMEALRGKLCTAENKGKKFEYTVNSDHMVGKVKLKDRNTSLTCHTVKAK
jgi:hypothetical protein